MPSTVIPLKTGAAEGTPHSLSGTVTTGAVSSSAEDSSGVNCTAIVVSVRAPSEMLRVRTSRFTPCAGAGEVGNGSAGRLVNDPSDGASMRARTRFPSCASTADRPSPAIAISACVCIDQSISRASEPRTSS